MITKEQGEYSPTIVLNKIFSGSHLDYNIGHEIINFIKADKTDDRFIYLSSLGNKARITPKYIFHIMRSHKQQKGVPSDYELVAVSEVSEDANTVYKKVCDSLPEERPTFYGYDYGSIFSPGDSANKVYLYTYKCQKFYTPKEDTRIIFKIKRQESKANCYNQDAKTLELELRCNPQHDRCYACKSDEKILSSLLKDERLVETNDSVNLDEIPNEQCFAIISGRAQLEVSTSNQLAYFLRRDKNLLYKFLHDFLGVDIEKNEEFEIVREKEENIDLLFKSKLHVIVVENKIDSAINNVANDYNGEGKYASQLSKYYSYVEKNYSTIKKENRHFFLLAPIYSSISQKELNERYENGSSYTLKNFTELYENIKEHEYKPLGKTISDESKFLFKQFKESIEYLTWSHAKQRERTAYIRLKQRINELASQEVTTSN